MKISAQRLIKTLGRMAFLLWPALPAVAVVQTHPFRGEFVNRHGGQVLTLDLYDESIEVPAFEFLGTTNGYLHGNVYGVWFVTRATVSGRTATVHLTNEFGSEAQTVKLTLQGDTALAYQAEGSLVIKRVGEGRKLIKLPQNMIFVRSTAVVAPKPREQR